MMSAKKRIWCIMRRNIKKVQEEKNFDADTCYINRQVSFLSMLAGICQLKLKMAPYRNNMRFSLNLTASRRVGKFS